MSHQDFKSEAEKEKIIADPQEQTPKSLHKVVSNVYIAVIVLCIPLILCSLTYGNALATEFAVISLWVIGSIVVSRILINNKHIRIAYLVLFSAPVIGWLFLVRDTW